jgi:hypothetical protein
MEKRTAEIEHASKVCQFLCNTYPQFFAMSEYTHPVLGACTSLVIKNYDNTNLDVANITEIRFEMDNNKIIVVADKPTRSFVFNKIVIDETVM